MNSWLILSNLLLSLVLTMIAHAQDFPPTELKHFTPIRTITLDEPDTLLIAAINGIDVDLFGRMLVTDKLGEQVLLLDSTGTLLASLDPRNCHPGFTFRPIGAMFGGNEFILLMNAGPWGYRFTSDGACLGSMHSEFVLPDFLDINSAGELVGVLDGPHWEIRQMDPTGITVNSFAIPEPKFPHASGRFDAGGFITDGTHFYYAWATEPSIMKFSADGTYVDRIHKRASYFKSPRKDVPGELSPALWTAMQNWTGTITRNLFELSDQTIMVQYIDQHNGGGYQVFSKEGELIAEELGIGGWWFIHAGHGLAYGLVQPDLDERGELPNPSLPFLTGI